MRSLTSSSCVLLCRKSEAKECITPGGSGLVPGHNLPLFSGLWGSVLPLSGLVIATIPLAPGPLHMHFPLSGSISCSMLYFLVKSFISQLQDYIRLHQTRRIWGPCSASSFSKSSIFQAIFRSYVDLKVVETEEAM